MARRCSIPTDSRISMLSLSTELTFVISFSSLHTLYLACQSYECKLEACISFVPLMAVWMCLLTDVAYSCASFCMNNVLRSKGVNDFIKNHIYKFITTWCCNKYIYTDRTKYFIIEKHTCATVPVGIVVWTDSVVKWCWLGMYHVGPCAHGFVTILLSLCTVNICIECNESTANGKKILSTKKKRNETR